MSITRKLLKGMGLTDEQQDTIIEAYTDAINAIKDERDAYKADAEKLADVQKQLDDLKGADDGGWEKKYNALKSEYDEYKNDQDAKALHNAKENAVRAILRDIGVSEKRIDKVIKLCDVDGIELDENGGVKDAETLKASLSAEWSDFIVTTETKGANVANPPANNGGATMTKEQIMNIKDAGERQRAIAQNLQLFGVESKGD